MAKKQTAGRDRLGKLAPEFARLNDDVLFGEVWSREEQLSPRDRSLITISALFSAGLYPQLKAHLQIGKEHGLTKQEVVEAITQLAFYCGWLKAWSSFPLVEEVWEGQEDQNGQAKQGTQTAQTSQKDSDIRQDQRISDEAGFDKKNLFGRGEPNVAYQQYFIGQSYLNPLTDAAHGEFPLHNVTFEPGCRNNWHIHRAVSGGGQMLICIAGSGWYQEEGKPARSLNPGDVVVIPANVKHWHGAKKDSWFSHIALEVPGEQTSNEWCEPVTDEHYDALEA